MQLRHENLVQMVDMFVSGGDGGPGDVYIVTEVMDCDLGALINSPWGCPYELHSEHVQFILYQMVRGLKYIHSAEVTTPYLTYHHPPHLSPSLLPSALFCLSHKLVDVWFAAVAPTQSTPALLHRIFLCVLHR